MKSFTMFLYCLVLTCMPTAIYGQGSFTNLDFESANNLPNVSPTQAVLVPVTNAFPGWTVYEGGGQTTQVFYNGISAGGPLVTLVTTNTGGNTFSGETALAGNYSATLDDGEGGNGSAAIAQTGLVPSTAKSLVFIASGDIADQLGELSVTFSGQNLPVIEIAQFSGYNEYGADISAFAGTSGQLEFTESVTGRPIGFTILDNISFSPNEIPEPATWELLLCGAVLFGIGRWKRKR